MTKEFKLANMASFQHFDPTGAQALAMKLGGMFAEASEQDAADWWFSAAAVIASGAHPPHEQYEYRVTQACRISGAALIRIAERWEAQAQKEREAKQKDQSNGKGKRGEKPGQKPVQVGDNSAGHGASSAGDGLGASA